MDLAKVCIKSTFFAFQYQFYEQTEGAVMGSPLSPVLANIYIEAFEKKALESTTLKPKCWYRYVDDTFIISPQGRNTVADFLDHVHGIHPDIQFTMEVEKNPALPFLDVLVERKPDVQPPPNPETGDHKQLDHRAWIISEPRYLAQELAHLRTALRGNDYTARNIERAIRGRHMPMEKQEYLATTYLPYVKGCTDKIGRLLTKRNMNTVFSSVYIGQTGRQINTGLKEHKSHLKNNNSTVAEHRADTGHTVDLSEANMVGEDFGPDYTEKH
ncbi:uncharacterized protein LOC108913427 [Anoplophora glabripennis]|uniref:uncharacterized protein LOC108913427 n=1 Tax=Anoplophora glabripennis TaxID=217634 RepID=UPI00087479FD|nr:uncharacterized protein LOC108913427 [Anoplophora glabripennis]